MECGLLGRTLGHSYSPQIHNLLSDYNYTLFEKEPAELEEFLKNGSFSGLNVTIPYKKSVIPYCAKLSPIAEKLGAVNTIIRLPDGSLMGHNTDYFGFASMVDKSGLSVAGKKVLVLGSGGASNTAVAVLKALYANVVIISRSGEDNYSNLSRHKDTAIIVNTTPVGMYPNTEDCPVDLSQFPNLEGVLDVIYNPAHTALLQAAENRGIITENGLWMLVAQAKESAEWFTGSKIPNERITEIHQLLSAQMENIVLIGMPGCGKSTIGQIIAARLNRTFVDADVEIVKEAGMTIPEIFEKQGEAGFRKTEKQVLARLGKQSGLVIATGGGCVTRIENYSSLHQNGKIIWLKRNIHDLPTAGRPLSKSGNLEQMYQQRKPLYASFADITVENNSVPEDTVCTILKLLTEEKEK